MLLGEVGVSVEVEALPPTELDEVAGCCCEAVWPAVIAPADPPPAAVWEALAPWSAEAEEVEHLSASMFTLETVMEFPPAFELALALPALLWAEAPPAMVPMIWTWWPTCGCSMLLSPCNW